MTARRSVVTYISNEALRQTQDLRQQSSPARGYDRQELRGIYSEGISVNKTESGGLDPPYFYRKVARDVSARVFAGKIELLFDFSRKLYACCLVRGDEGI